MFARYLAAKTIAKKTICFITFYLQVLHISTKPYAIFKWFHILIQCKKIKCRQILKYILPFDKLFPELLYIHDKCTSYVVQL